MFHVWRSVLLLLAVLATAGCTTPIARGKSPLLPALLPADSIVLDIFFVRFPFGDPEVNEKLWDQLDEQCFSPNLRERLASNGFRAGLLTGQMPVELSTLLELSDKPPPAGNLEETKVENAEVQPRVVRRHLQLSTGQRSEILASSVYEQLPVLVCNGGQLSGQTYYQAQGLFAVKPFPQPDGRIRLELTPELHYGQAERHWLASQGIMRMEIRRPRQVFDDMQIATNLSPGAIVVLSSLPDHPGSLGHHFFTENNDRREQKLLVVRLSQTQHDDLFDPAAPESPPAAK